MYLTELSMAELAELLAQMGQPRYRARQVHAWLTRGVRPADMTDLPRALRERLAALPFGAVEIADRRVSARDGTVKYLFALEDGNLIEGVLMRYKYGNTACISTQVGCRMGCAFCASTLEGCVRSLHAGEMLGQIAAIERDEGAPPGRRAVTNVVLMGSGEPLDNLDNVLRFLRLVTAQEGMRISPRNISVSTCGLVPQMERFTAEAPHVTLSVSLHAHDDETRSRIMPVNRAYPIAGVLRAARGVCRRDGAARRVRIRAHPRPQRRGGGRGGACAPAARHELPCEPHPAQPGAGARPARRDAPGGGRLPGVAHARGRVRHRAARDGDGY